jgi:ABC-type branched-subunit amino acid transport system ATPase component
MRRSELPLLSAKGLRKSFGGVPIFNGVSLTLAAGTITILSGRNGSGKTTLVNCLTGFELSYDGDISLCGTNLRGLSIEQRVRLGLVRTFQNPHLFSEFNVAKHLELGQLARISALRSYCTWRHGELPADIIRELELSSLLERDGDELSFGEMKVVNTARALATDAKVLLLDEPLASLHGYRQKLIVQAIARRAQSGCAVLVIEHELQELIRIANAHYVLVDGRLIYMGDS